MTPVAAVDEGTGDNDADEGGGESPAAVATGRDRAPLEELFSESEEDEDEEVSLTRRPGLIQI